MIARASFTGDRGAAQALEEIIHQRMQALCKPQEAVEESRAEPIPISLGIEDGAFEAAMLRNPNMPTNALSCLDAMVAIGRATKEAGLHLLIVVAKETNVQGADGPGMLATMGYQAPKKIAQEMLEGTRMRTLEDVVNLEDLDKEFPPAEPSHFMSNQEGRG